MAEQLRGPFEKFVDWRQCATVMLLCLPLHNSDALPPVHKLLEQPSYIRIYPQVFGENKGKQKILNTEVASVLHI